MNDTVSVSSMNHVLNDIEHGDIELLLKALPSDLEGKKTLLKYILTDTSKGPALMETAAQNSAVGDAFREAIDETTIEYAVAYNMHSLHHLFFIKADELDSLLPKDPTKWLRYPNLTKILYRAYERLLSRNRPLSERLFVKIATFELYGKLLSTNVSATSLRRAITALIKSERHREGPFGTLFAARVVSTVLDSFVDGNRGHVLLEVILQTTNDMRFLAAYGILFDKYVAGGKDFQEFEKHAAVVFRKNVLDTYQLRQPLVAQLMAHSRELVPVFSNLDLVLKKTALATIAQNPALYAPCAYLNAVADGNVAVCNDLFERFEENIRISIGNARTQGTSAFYEQAFYSNHLSTLDHMLENKLLEGFEWDPNDILLICYLSEQDVTYIDTLRWIVRTTNGPLAPESIMKICVVCAQEKYEAALDFWLDHLITLVHNRSYGDIALQLHNFANQHAFTRMKEKLSTKLPQKGGAFVGNGTYGCVVTPAVPCTAHIIGKLILNPKLAFNELNVSRQLMTIDPLQETMVYAQSLCVVANDNVLANDPDVKTCKSRMEIPDDQTPLFQLLYSKFGTALSKIIEDILFDITAPKEYAGLKNVLKGISKLNSNDIIHNDVKMDNIICTSTDTDTDTDITPSVSKRGRTSEDARDENKRTEKALRIGGAIPDLWASWKLIDFGELTKSSLCYNSNRFEWIRANFVLNPPEVAIFCHLAKLGELPNFEDYALSLDDRIMEHHQTLISHRNYGAYLRASKIQHFKNLQYMAYLSLQASAATDPQHMIHERILIEKAGMENILITSELIDISADILPTHGVWKEQIMSVFADYKTQHGMELDFDKWDSFAKTIDVYAFGILVLNLMHMSFVTITKFQNNPEHWRNYEKLKKMVKECINADPLQRPTAERLLEKYF